MQIPLLRFGAALALAAAISCCAMAAAPAASASVSSSLKHLQKTHQISKGKARKALAAYELARSVKRKTKRARRKAISSHIRMVESMSRRRLITASRVTPLFMTLKYNALWFKSNGPRPAGTDRRFAGSRIIFQYFKGKGWQFHPLSNFARLNAVWTVNDKPSNRAARQFAKELIRWGAKRNKALVWEYYFSFSGSAAPFISSISQGTAIQALSRVGYRFNNGSMKRAAVRGSIAFNVPAPNGLRVRRDKGFHYVGYSGRKNLIILNMFLQSIDAIHDFAIILNNRKGRYLYTRGVDAARVETPKFDTGDWSLYSLNGPKSSLSYHLLTITFLKKLCTNTKDDVFCNTADKFQSYVDK